MISMLFVVWLCSGVIGPASAQQDAGLPLHITPAVQQDNEAPLVFFLSGDGGWYRFCQPFSDHMAALNMPVIGLDSKKYFWNTVSPAQAAQDMVPVIEQYLVKWNRKKVILAGFSFGADVLPFIYDQFPPELQQKTKIIVMMSPARTTDFQVHYIDMMGMGEDQYPYQVLPAMHEIKNTPVLCIYGEEEDSVFPPDFQHPNIKIEKVKGAHHFKDGEEVSQLIVAAMR